MYDLISLFLFAADPPAPAAPEGPSVWNVMVPYLAVITLLYFFMSSPRRREQAKRDEALKNLKKNDRVVTIGGIFGSVVSVSEDGKEVTLKVDDSTRIRFRKTAIADVLQEEAPPPPSTAPKPS